MSQDGTTRGLTTSKLKLYKVHTTAKLTKPVDTSGEFSKVVGVVLLFILLYCAYKGLDAGKMQIQTITNTTASR